MNIDKVNTQINEVLRIKVDVSNLSSNSRSYTLDDYIESFNRCLSVFDHGQRDKFFVPYHHASLKLQDISDNNYSFAVKKTKLLSGLNQYVKGLQRGLKEQEKELNANRESW